MSKSMKSFCENVKLIIFNFIDTVVNPDDDVDYPPECLV